MVYSACNSFSLPPTPEKTFCFCILKVKVHQSENVVQYTTSILPVWNEQEQFGIVQEPRLATNERLAGEMMLDRTERSASADAKRGLVLLAGELFDVDIFALEWAFIAAADGGARHALTQNIRLDYVVGDFDSLRPDEVERLKVVGVSMGRLPREKDLTDGEAVVQWAIDQGTADEIVVAGGLGGRFDHSLGSVILLEQIAQAGLRGCVTDGRQTVYLLRDGLVVYGEPGDQLSIVPLTPRVTGVGAQGVRWPLTDATLTASSTLTLSNELTDTSATFAHKSGRAVVVHVPKRYK